MSTSDVSRLSEIIGIPEEMVIVVLSELVAGSFLEQTDLRRHLVEECIKKYPSLSLGKVPLLAA